MSHTIPIRIYYEDTDAGGVVYHANYLKFGERGRTEFLRYVGYTNSDIQKDYGVIFVVRHIECDYQKPAFLDDALTLKTSITSVKRSSFVMTHCVFKADYPICDMTVSLVCVDSKTLKPVRLPDDIKEAFLKHGDLIDG